VVELLAAHMPVVITHVPVVITHMPVVVAHMPAAVRMPVVVDMPAVVHMVVGVARGLLACPPAGFPGCWVARQNQAQEG